MLFRDRHDAGRQLGHALQRYRQQDPVIFAMARGGIPVGFEVARILNAPLEPLIVRKLGAPLQPELAVGAIASGGVMVLNPTIVQMLDITPDQIEHIRHRAHDELRRLERLFHSRPDPEAIRGRTLIVVDDGIATGATIEAGLQALSAMEPEKLVLAVPVASPDTLDRLRKLVDDQVCLKEPDNLIAVGYWYQQFPQVTNDEVMQLLLRSYRLTSPHYPNQ